MIRNYLPWAVGRLFLAGPRARSDLLSLQALEPLATRYVPWNAMSMTPTAVTTLVNDIVVNERRTIVECGAGISTAFIARLLRQRGEGRLITIDHDPEWAAVIDRALQEERLSEWVHIVTAPLAPTELSWDGEPWYSEEVLARLDVQDGIDLLVVDGPPAYAKELRHARYPALPFFSDSLAPNCTLILDDVGRRGELDVVARWEQEVGIGFERRLVAGNLAIGHRGPCFVD